MAKTMGFNLASLEIAQICEVLRDNGFDEEVAESMRINKIDGAMLLDLSSQDLKELGIVALGDRKRLEKLCQGSIQEPQMMSKPSMSEFSTISPGDSRSPSPIPCNQRKRNRVLEVSSESDEESTAKLGASEIGDDDVVVQNKVSYTPDRVVQGVPNHLNGWEHEFSVPKQYSETVMAALTAKKISSNVRAQISQDVATKMLGYCKYPTSDQYEVVAQKIVATFPVLRDSMGTGYNSWTKSLKNRFKNMRRVPRSARTGLEFMPPARKGKCTLNHNWSVDSGRSIDEATYKRHKTALSHQQSTESILILMKETATNRREWIKKDRPTIKVILEEFPCLKDYTVLIEEFKSLVLVENSPEDTLGVAWEKIRSKSISFSEVERKPVMINLLELARKDKIPEENKSTVSLLLLSMLLDKRYKNGGDSLLIFIEAGDDPNQAISNIKCNSPLLLATGEDPLHIQQYLLIVEKQVFCSIGDFHKAILSLFACYYVFDMAYPRECKNTLLYLESALLKLSSSEKLSSGALAAISAMDKL